MEQPKSASGRHYVSSPTSEEVLTPVDEPKEGQKKATKDKPKNKSGGSWPEFPLFIEKGEKLLQTDDYLALMCYMLGADTEPLTIAALRHLLLVFYRNEQELYGYYKRGYELNSEKVKKILFQRERFRNTLKKETLRIQG